MKKPDRSTCNIFLGTSNDVKKLEITRFFEQCGGKYNIKRFEKKLELEEIGDTFEEIVRWKAMRYSEFSDGELFLSDDSGLCVDCLGGRPGIHSARFPYEGVSDCERNYALLELLSENGDSERTAVFHSAIAVGIDGKILASAVGTCAGRVISEPRGNNGFGFDPIFIPCGMDKTFAEMSVDDKLEVSHRGIALRKILALLEGSVKLK